MALLEMKWSIFIDELIAFRKMYVRLSVGACGCTTRTMQYRGMRRRTDDISVQTQTLL